MQLEKKFSSFLDFSRWVAALLVLVGHVRSFMFFNFVDLDPEGKKGIFTVIFYFFTKQGHRAVMIFFVLSGFLVGGKLLGRAGISRDFYKKEYFISRFSRLLIVSVPGILLGYLLDRAGASYFNHNQIYNNYFHFNTINFDCLSRLSPANLLASLFMLQTLIALPVGSNYPLWSLAYEFYYYILIIFVLEAVFFKKISSMVLFFAIAVILSCLNRELMLYFLIFLMGASLNKIDRPLIRNPYICLVLFLLTFLPPEFGVNTYLCDFLIAACFCLLLNSVRFLTPEIYGPTAGANSFLARFSYSLYIIHLPIIFLGVAVITNKLGFLPRFTLGPGSFSIFILIVLTVLFIAYLFSCFTEKKTSSLKEYLFTVFNIKAG